MPSFPPVSALLLGLSASLSWGVADFFGGVASRRGRVAATVALLHTIGSLALGVVLLVRGEGPPPMSEMALGLVAGCGGGLGLMAFYRGLAIGAMGLVAPVSALGVIIPVGWGIARGERPGALVAVGLVLALLAAVLVSRTGEKHSRRGLGHAALAAVGFGFFFVFLAPAAETDALWATGAARCASVPIVIALALMMGGTLRPGGGQMTLIVVAGLLDVGANVLYALATQRGLTSVVAVLGSLYPVATVVLARVVLHERLSRLQAVGAAGALAGVALIATG
jgi:drug/metabolite transporter (DMT)-like permease